MRGVALVSSARRAARLGAGISVLALTVSGLAACATTSLSLGKGDCFTSPDFAKSPDGGRFSNLTKLACNQPHDAEVIASSKLAEGPFPGAEELDSAARTFCVESFATVVGVPLEESALDIRPVYPTKESWEKAADREILCVAVSPDQITGSVVGSKK